MPKRRDENAPYWQQLKAAERGIIEYALEHGKTMRGTAAILGISPNFLSERAKELGIEPPEVKPGPKPGTKPNRPNKPALRVVGSDPEPEPEPEDEDEDADDEIDETAELDDEGDEDEDEDDEEDDDEEIGDGEGEIGDTEGGDDTDNQQGWNDGDQTADPSDEASN